MNVHSILAKPVWKALAMRPGFATVGEASILATDGFFDYLLEHGLSAPSAGDVVMWLKGEGRADVQLTLDLLEDTFSLFDPSFLRQIADARQQLAKKSPGANQSPVLALPKNTVMLPSYEILSWDPIARPPKRPPILRHVSIQPDELPLDYQETIRRAARGLPGRGAEVKVPARSMVLRMREKLCQCMWSIRNNDFQPVLSPIGIDRYVKDLISRCSLKPHGLRWSSIRASVDGLYLFARYHGEEERIISHLRCYIREFEARERAQRALKFFKLARTGNTTDRMLDQAERLLIGADAELSPGKRHQMRNAAAILAIYANAPLRNASAQLAFGTTLFWENNHWVIRTKIQKTHTSRPELLVLPLHPECGRFIDAILLQDSTPVLLPHFREQAIQERRQLFCLVDERPAAASYIPRVFRALTGNSFTTLRVMHYSDAIRHHGPVGIELAKHAAHHSPTASGTDIVKIHYIAEEVAQLDAEAMRARRDRRVNSMREQYRADFNWNSQP